MADFAEDLPRTWQPSVCPHDCPDCCGMLAQTDGQRVFAVRGDPNHGHNQGRLCAKVGHYERTVHTANRVLTPLLRDGPKGSGQFRKTSWDEAIALIARRWRHLFETAGAESILPVSYAGTMGQVQRNAGHALFHKMGASRLDRTICTPAQNAGWDAVMGKRPGPDPDEAAESDLIVLWGCNALATNLQFVQWIRQAQRRGAQVWLIDTHRQISASLADKTLVVRPGSDAALALGIVAWLASHGRCDEAFLAEACTGWPELRSAALDHYPLERVTAITGLAPQEFLEFCGALANARAPFLRLGGGPTRYATGAASTRAILCIPALLGAWTRPGGGALASTGSGAALDMTPLTRPDLQPGPTRLVNLTQLGNALTELDDPPIRSIFVYHCNPVAVLPDQNRVLQGLLRDDLFTVVHERFLTDTAMFADIVLPAPTMLETADLYRSYGQYYLRRTRPVVAPLGESRANLDVFQAIAKALGYRDAVFETSADQFIEMVLDIPSPLRPTSGPHTFDRAALDRGEAVKLVPQRPRWGDPEAMIRLTQSELPDPVPHWRPTHAASDNLPLVLQTAPSQFRLNSSFAERHDLTAKVGPQTLQLSPTDALARGLADGQQVIAHNSLGEVEFLLRVTDVVPAGVAVAEGVHWLTAEGNLRNVNALTSQRLTDLGNGSTYYDNGIEVRPAP